MEGGGSCSGDGSRIVELLMHMHFPIQLGFAAYDVNGLGCAETNRRNTYTSHEA